MRRLVLGLLVCGGCAEVLGLHEIDQADGGMPADAPSGDASSPCAFSDRFDGDDTALVLDWDRMTSSPSCMATEQSGELQLVLAPLTRCYAWVATNKTYSFVGARATVRVAAIPNDGDVESYFSVALDDQNFYYFVYTTGNIRLRARVGNVDVDEMNVQFDSVAHVYWRIEHDAVTKVVRFATSPNGSDFTVRYTIPVRVPVDTMSMELGAGTFSDTEVSPGPARFDDFELCLSGQ